MKKRKELREGKKGREGERMKRKIVENVKTHAKDYSMFQYQMNGKTEDCELTKDTYLV